MSSDLQSALTDLPGDFSAIMAARVSPRAAVVMGEDPKRGKFVVWNYYTGRGYGDGYYTRSLAEAWKHFQTRVELGLRPAPLTLTLTSSRSQS